MASEADILDDDLTAGRRAIGKHMAGFQAVEGDGEVGHGARVREVFRFIARIMSGLAV